MSFAACVIGAGPAGMCATVALRRVGAMVTCFEIHDSVGGIWNANVSDSIGPRGINSPIHPSMRTVLPKDLMSFSDKRFNFFTPSFPHHTAVRSYLHEYAYEKGISGFVRFNTMVQRVRRDPANHCWRVTTVNFRTGDIFDWKFDAVVVATGRTSDPRFPEEMPEGEHDFLLNGGTIRHVSEAKNFREFKDKRVVVAGDGVAAYEHCRLLIEAGAQVFHSTMITPSTRDPSLLDTPQSSRALSLAGVLNNLPIADTTTHKGREILCRWLRRDNSNNLRCPRVGRILAFDADRNAICEADPTRRWTEEEKRLWSGKLKKEKKDMERWRLTHPDLAENPDVEAENPTTPIDDGSKITIEGVDAVIYATGYHLRFPFLPQDIRDEVEAKPLLRLMQQAPYTPPPPPPPPPGTPAATADSSTVSAESTTNEESAEEIEAKLVENLKADLRNGTAVQHRGLFMGTVYVKDPSLAFVGLPNDLLPPFVVFQAQARYIAAVMSRRVPIPATEEEMREQEKNFMSIYTSRGAGTDTIPYYNALQQAAGPGGNSFVEEVKSRRLWFIGTWALNVVHKVRQLSPLKRKKQHVIISNDV